MKKLAFVAFCAATALLAQGPPPGGRGFGGRGPGMGPGQFERTVTGAPYTATETSNTVQTLSNGNVINRTTTTNIARDSQGRTRVETTVKHPDGTTATRVTIHDPVAGVVHQLDSVSRVSHDSPMHTPPANGQGRGRRGANSTATGADVARGGRRADPNMVTEKLGAQTIAGVQASGTRMTHTIPAGQEGNAQPIVSTHETWMSEDLKVPVMVKSTDPRFGTTTTQLTNVVRAEPDPTLFQVPAGYTSVKDHGGPGPRGPRPNGQK